MAYLITFVYEDTIRHVTQIETAVYIGGNPAEWFLNEALGKYTDPCILYSTEIDVQLAQNIKEKMNVANAGRKS